MTDDQSPETVAHSDPASEEVDIDTLSTPTLADLLADLEARVAADPRPAKGPPRLRLRDIKRLEALFQPRPLDGHHLATLKASLAVTEVLDAVTVIRIGPTAVLVDGHHRVRAYEDRGTKIAIPVRWWTGSVREAVLEASRENAKTKLTMTTGQRMDRAWRLVTSRDPKTGKHLFSKESVRSGTGVANGTLGNMREVATKLRAMGLDFADYPRWWAAVAASRGEEAGEWTDEARAEWEETKAKDFTSKLAKTFGPMLARHPGAAATAIANYCTAYAAEGGSHLQQSPLVAMYDSLGAIVAAVRGEGGSDDGQDWAF